MEVVAGPSRLRRLGGESRKFVQDNALATSSTLVAGILGFALQAIAGHALHPGAYAKAAAVVGFYTVLTPGAALGRLVAWQTSIDLSAPEQSRERSGILLRSLTLRLLIIGGFVVAASCIAGPFISRFLHVPLRYIIVGSVAVPFVLAVQPLLGCLQGEQRFVSWSMLTVLVGVSRLVFVVALVFGFGAFGVIGGTTIAAAATFVVCLAVLWQEFSAFKGRYAWRPVIPFILVGLAATLAIGVFVSINVIIVEHFYDKVKSGEYAIVSVLGNAVYFLTGGIASVVFPMVARRHASDRSTFGVMTASLSLCAAAGIVGALVLQLFARPILLHFAGKAYVGGASILGFYAVGMAILGCVVVLVNTQQSLNRLAVLWVLGPITLLRPALIFFFHRTLLTVVVVSNLTVLLFAIAMLAMYIYYERARLGSRGGSTTAPPTILPPVVPPLGQLLTDREPAEGLELGEGPDLWTELGRTLRRGAEWCASRPRVVGGMLALLGLVVWNAWLTLRPLTSGDWNWESHGAAAGFFPWPSIWNNTLGLNGENTFLNVFRFPVFALDGFISSLGGSWSVVEKLVYFLPFAVLLPVAGWLLAREVLGPTKWTLLTPIILLGSTYFVIEANSEIPLALAECLGCLALVAFIRAMRRRSIRWGLVTGLMVGITAAVDIRPAYLVVLLIVLYLVVLTIAEPSWPAFRQRCFIAAVAGVAFVATQAYWVVPLLTYGGSVQLPIPSSPDFNIITLEHGIAGVSAFWTGGAPANLVEAPLNPLFMVLPIVAMLPLLWRRLQPELIWLALAAVSCSFLAKTNTAPFGGIYDFLYRHVPGFNLFREGSKFLFVVTVAYAILIPAALRSMAQLHPRYSSGVRRALRLTSVACLTLVVGLSAWGVLVVEQGKLGSTTTPIAQPRAFHDVSTILGADHQPGNVLWFGSPVYTTPDQKSHRFVIASSTHPLVNLTGNPKTTELNRRDYFQYFCPVISQAYCYLTPALFPYLASMVSASYVVSPVNLDLGVLPPGITRMWLRQQLTTMFGAPREVGASGTQLLVWHLRGGQRLVGSYPAIALVDSGSWSLPSILPALEAMGIPAAYRQSFDVAQFPSAPADLPDSLTVLPRVDGGCRGTTGTTVGVMARSTSVGFYGTVGGRFTPLLRLARTTRLPGWSLYGPFRATAGLTMITTTSPGITLGPCVGWSSLTTLAFGSHPQAAGPARSGEDGEQVKASLVGPPGPWVELRSYYDRGWHLAGQKPIAVGDGLFNLYHPTHPASQAHGLVLMFSTRKWERIGQVLAFLSVVGILLLAWRIERRQRSLVLPPPPQPSVEGRSAPLLAAAGVFFLGLTALATLSDWFGLPSRAPWTALMPDPYNVDVVFGSVALALLGLSMVVRLGEHLVARSSLRLPGYARFSKPRRAAAGAVMVLSIVLVGCGANIENANQTLANARAAGAASRDVSGASLDEARISFQAKHPYQCVADYTEALRSFPGLASAYSGRAACYLSFDPAASVHDLNRALALSSGNPGLLLARAAAKRSAGDLNGATDDYLASASAPSSPPVESLAATDGLIGMGQLGAAAHVVSTLTSRFPNDAISSLAVADLAVAQGYASRAGAALARADQLTAQNPSELVFVLSRECGYQVLEHAYQSAVATCERAAVTGEDGSGAFDNLSAAHVGLGDLSAAIVDLTSSIGAFEGNIGPNAQPAGVDGFGLANLYEGRGRLYIELHQPKLALADYHAAMAALPPGTPDLAAQLREDIKSADQD